MLPRRYGRVGPVRVVTMEMGLGTGKERQICRGSGAVRRGVAGKER